MILKNKLIKNLSHNNKIMINYLNKNLGIIIIIYNKS